jgi:hypothetical protein
MGSLGERDLQRTPYWRDRTGGSAPKSAALYATASANSFSTRRFSMMNSCRSTPLLPEISRIEADGFSDEILELAGLIASLRRLG